MMQQKQTTDRWTLAPGQGIVWRAEGDFRLPHEDHIEMSGRRVSLIIRYGADEEGRLTLARQIIWPLLRTIPNNTHASLKQEYGASAYVDIRVNGEPLGAEQLAEARFDGLLSLCSLTASGIKVERVLFPAATDPSALERCTLTNTSAKAVRIEIAAAGQTINRRGVFGIYVLETTVDAPASTLLAPQESLTFYTRYSGRKLLETAAPLEGAAEEAKRREFVRFTASGLRLETPDAVLNRMFALAKLRTSESIFATKGGLMHAPGGGSYYAAVWANDQAEYVGPFVPYLGGADQIAAALNAYRLYQPFMGPDYAAIPSSIIAEGTDIWEGKGDRGDAAMYAYGAAHFVLALGDEAVARELWPAIRWCLEYCRRKLTEDGVVASDSDELEGRFPAGTANLSTSSLYYGALRASARLAQELVRDWLDVPDGAVQLEKASGAVQAGVPGAVAHADADAAELAANYESAADALAVAIECYFGAEVEGFDTYRYYDGNDKLRSWICLPLAMGIMERESATLQALFSPRLWTDDGLATEAGDTTFWDRSTLYGFQAAFRAGEVKRALPLLQAYSRRRLLGEHVPYAVEAYPEGNQRHLAAESALYCRIFTEGLFGIKPTGFRSFTCTPRLPAGWNSMALRSIRAFGASFDVEICRTSEGSVLLLTEDSLVTRYSCCDGDTLSIDLSGEKDGAAASKTYDRPLKEGEEEADHGSK